PITPAWNAATGAGAARCGSMATGAALAGFAPSRASSAAGSSIGEGPAGKAGEGAVAGSGARAPNNAAARTVPGTAPMAAGSAGSAGGSGTCSGCRRCAVGSGAAPALRSRGCMPLPSHRRGAQAARAVGGDGPREERPVLARRPGAVLDGPGPVPVHGDAV